MSTSLIDETNPLSDLCACAWDVHAGLRFLRLGISASYVGTSQVRNVQTNGALVAIDGLCERIERIALDLDELTRGDLPEDRRFALAARAFSGVSQAHMEGGR